MNSMYLFGHTSVRRDKALGFEILKALGPDRRDALGKPVTPEWDRDRLAYAFEDRNGYQSFSVNFPDPLEPTESTAISILFALAGTPSVSISTKRNVEVPFMKTDRTNWFCILAEGKRADYSRPEAVSFLLGKWHAALGVLQPDFAFGGGIKNCVERITDRDPRAEAWPVVVCKNRQKAVNDSLIVQRSLAYGATMAWTSENPCMVKNLARMIQCEDTPAQ